MVVLSAQSETPSVALPNSGKVISAAIVTSGFGNLAQGLLTAIALPSIGFSNSTKTNLSSNYSSFIIQGNFQDYLSSFARFFGVNARQDASKIYIQKADLPNLDLLLDNSAESLLVALLLRAMLYESNSLISTVHIFIFNKYFINNLLITNLVLELYLPIIDPLTPTENLPSFVPNSFL